MRLISTISSVFRLAKWILVVGALVAFSAVAALYLLVTPQWITERLESYCAETFLVKLHLKELPSVKHLPRLEISLPAGTFSDLQDGQEIGNFASAQLNASPWKLLLGQIHVLDASVQGFHTALAIPDHNAPCSWDSLLIPEKSSAWIAPLVIDRVQLSNSSIELAGLGDAPVRISIKELASAEIAPVMTSDFHVSGQIASPSYQMAADFSATGTVDLDAANHIAGLRDSRLTLTGTLGESPFETAVNVAVAQVTGNHVAGNVRVSTDIKGQHPLRWSAALQDLSTKEGIVAGNLSEFLYSQTLANGSVSVKAASPASFDIGNQTLSLQGGSFSCAVDSPALPAVDLSGSIDGKFAFSTQKGEATVVGKLNGTPAKLFGNWETDPKLSVSATLDTDSLDLTAKDAAQHSFSLRELARILGSLPESSAFDADVRASSIQWGNLSGNHLSAKISSDAQGLSVTNATVGIAGGEAKFALNFNNSDTGRLESTFTGIELSKLVPPVQGKPFSGQLSGTIRLTGLKDFPPSQESLLQGEGELRLTAGQMTGPENRTSAFSEASCRASVQNGLLVCEPLDITWERMQSKGSVEINLATADISGTPSLHLKDGRVFDSKVSGKYYAPDWVLPEEIRASEPAEATPPAADPTPVEQPAPAAVPAVQTPSPAENSFLQEWGQKLKGWVQSWF